MIDAVLFVSSVAAFTGGIVGQLPPALIESTDMLPDDPGYLAGVVPVGRLGRPAEVADMALAMLRNEYLTSKVISLDGGRHPR